LGVVLDARMGRIDSRQTRFLPFATPAEAEAAPDKHRRIKQEKGYR
jgi:hypothetical protein